MNIQNCNSTNFQAKLVFNEGMNSHSQKLQNIAKKFEEWCDECGAAKDALSMVGFLRLHNLLIVDECNKYAEQNKDILNNGG